MLTRNFDFLKHKYRELLRPTLLMLLSDKICFIVDVALIGFFISDSTLLAAINLASLSSTFQQFYTPYLVLAGAYWHSGQNQIRMMKRQTITLALQLGA